MKVEGRAYPTPKELVQPGLSKREYFAIRALEGLLAGRKGELQTNSMTGSVQLAVNIADSLLAALGEVQ